MPDWLSHVLIGLVIAEAFDIKKKSLVVLGALLPDFLPKLHLLFFYLGIPQNIPFGAFHTPALAFLAILLITPLFKFDQKKVVWLLSLGALTHFLSDLTMRHFSGGQYLFFPFSFTRLSLNWLWPNDSLYLALGLGLVYSIILSLKRLQLPRQSQKV